MMRNHSLSPWCTLLIATILFMAMMPSFAVTGKPLGYENKLGQVRLGSTFLDILEIKGAKPWEGPAMSGAEDVGTVLNPNADASSTSTQGGIPKGVPPANLPPWMRPPSAPSAPPASSSDQPSSSSSSSTYSDNWIKSKHLCVWMYEGKVGGKLGWYTFVFMNSRGRVVAVLCALADPKTTSPKILNAAAMQVRTSSGITLGTRLLDLIGKYDWPENFGQSNDKYTCSYPAKNVTYTIDATTRRVAAISIGIPIVLLGSNSDKGAQQQSGDKNAQPGSTPPGGAPGGAPGGSPGGPPSGGMPDWLKQRMQSGH